MLSVNEVDKFLGGRPLLQGVSFKLGQGERVALVGVNGSGKSTLLKICAGAISSDGGEVTMPRDATIGYLPQHAELDSGRSLRNELREVFAEVLSHQAEIDELAHRMGEVDPAGEEYEKIADRFGHLHHELDRLGAYEMDARIGQVSAGLGFRAQDLERPCSEFSGGWRMRVLLAKLLLHNPDVLLLDEPTNHLDLETMIWLEAWIRAADTSVLMVSHERAFMDNLAQRTFEIHEGRLAIYSGNYSNYLRLREERWAQWDREYKNQREEMEHIQSFIDRFRAKASKAVQVQSRVKQLEKIVPIPPPPKAAGSIHFRFPSPDRGSKEVFAAEGLAQRFGPLEVFKDLEFAIWRGDRVALVGLNGAGKSTLIKILAGLVEPSAGTLRKGSSTSVEYFAQYESEGLEPANTVWNEVAAAAPQGFAEQARAMLGGFFFSGDDVNKKIEVLSGGERTRVRLAKMLFSGSNTLLLDEPTNHLDLASRRTLEDAMCAFQGTIIFVSHDRVFLERVPTRIFEVKNGKLRVFTGNYDDYCRALASLGEESPLVSKTSGGGGASGAAGEKNARRGGQETGGADAGALSREERKEVDKRRRQIERQIADAEVEIAKLETRVKAINEELILPSVYSNPQRAAQLGAEQRTLRDEVTQRTAAWERLSQKLETEPSHSKS